MKKSQIKMLSFIKSFRFRAFFIVALLVIVPVLTSSSFIYHMSVDAYIDKKIDYKIVDDTLEKYRRQSNELLKKCLYDGEM